MSYYHEEVAIYKSERNSVENALSSEYQRTYSDTCEAHFLLTETFIQLKLQSLTGFKI